ncbi:hypothetical protein ACIHCQ_41755 [Streptomyces sp. NPDC052236]|uniref:hypothetical protein n=1 Tax=Streptomyces sp. NPDC052236 TaxID=3365686 RepID=UPI0037D1CBBF
MNRDRALRTLDELLTLRGAFIAVLSRRAPGCGRPAWHAAVELVREKFLRGHKGVDGRGYTEVLSEDHESVLRRSAFGDVTAVVAPYVVDYTLEQIVGRQLSKAFSSPAVLGARRPAFEEDLRARLLEHDPSGRFRDETQAHLLIARRP